MKLTEEILLDRGYVKDPNPYIEMYSKGEILIFKSTQNEGYYMFNGNGLNIITVEDLEDAEGKN